MTVILQENLVVVYLDDIRAMYEVPGDAKYVCIDPEIYICGGPDLHKMKGLKSFNNFAGNLKYVYYNDVSILYELKQNNPKVHYIGVLDPEFEDIDIEVIPITYPFATSHIWWPLNQTNSINLIFDFKTSKNMAVLAYSQITTGQGYWEVRLPDFKYLSDNIVETITHFKRFDTFLKINATERYSKNLLE